MSAKQRGIGRLFGRAPDVSAESAASRVSAFVYGNVLVMAALIALHPQDLLTEKGLLYVVGTGVSTFIAHVLAGSVAHRVRHDTTMTWVDLQHELRDSRPIASSVTVPTLVLLATFVGLDPAVALGIAIGVTVVRIALLGWVIGRFRQQRPSLRTFASGILLAIVAVGAAVLKLWLTH